jgi:uncharacterized membrane protein YfcA
MVDPLILLAVILAFLTAGCVKGVIGMGLPMVSLALLVATVGLKSAMALLLVPTIVTNIWQALVGGHFWIIFKRLWLFFVASMLAVWPGVMVLARVDARWLSLLLGLLIIFYAVVNLRSRPLLLPVTHEGSVGFVCGVGNGLITGMTGSSVFPGVAYLQSIGLTRDQLIQAMGILFTLSIVALGVAMGGQRLLSLELMALSSAALLPALLGMHLGQRLRRRLSEKAFRRVFFVGLLVMGCYLVARSLLK